MAHGLYGKYKWSELNFDTLIDIVKSYNDKEENLIKIRKAYELAKKSHEGVKRARWGTHHVHTLPMK